MTNLQALSFLENHLKKEPEENYPKNSRIHPLNTFPNGFVKREDELGFGISGTKFRKYCRLISFLRSFHEVIIIGGPYSNHVLGITQLLIENGIQPVLFLKGMLPKAIGNFFFLQMLVEPSSIHWIPVKEWENVLEMAKKEAKETTFILPEGAPLFPCFLGALSLPLDILRNEKEEKISFDHIFIDVGTGYTAAALMLAFAFIEKKVTCHFLITAGTEVEFLVTCKKLHGEFQQWLGQNFHFPTSFICQKPELSPSFGSTNAQTFQFIKEMARKEGFFLDPIYSAKLFYNAYAHIDKISGNVLLIHSGGALSLAGFQKTS
jgi:1-aminocyclopropane-1-carboxylate deaminase